jgi:hypothetical protein
LQPYLCLPALIPERAQSVFLPVVQKTSDILKVLQVTELRQELSFYPFKTSLFFT